MHFSQYYLECLSQASYLIGDETTGRAVLVDPRRDVDEYLRDAAAAGLSIEQVIETHFHADFLSGHLELAHATGAEIAYGNKANPEFEARLLADGERISLGEVELEIRHTPGHTPESICVVVYEHTDDDVPYGVLTGDTLFIGDVGRPDLLGSIGVTAQELAGQLYDSLHGQLLTLPDSTRVFPGHGAGSSCGKNLSSATSCSIGVQRTSNYALASMSKGEFIDVVTSGQTAPPAYFSFDAVLNQKLRPVFDESESPVAFSLDQVLEAQHRGAVVLDTRGPSEFALGHVEASINVGLDGRFAEFAGAMLKPEAEIVIVAEPGHELESRVRLARIGFDNVVGALDDLSSLQPDHPAVRVGSRIDVVQLRAMLDHGADLQLVDVRQPGETADGTIEDAALIPLTRINAQLDTLDPNRRTVVFCAGGFRSSIAASRLAQAGFGDVCDLLGGYGEWRQQLLATS